MLSKKKEIKFNKNFKCLRNKLKLLFIISFLNKYFKLGFMYEKKKLSILFSFLKKLINLKI